MELLTYSKVVYSAVWETLVYTYTQIEDIKFLSLRFRT
jgi:hypothetical protein